MTRWKYKTYGKRPVRRILSLILVLSVFFSMSACSDLFSSLEQEKNSQDTDPEEDKVITLTMFDKNINDLTFTDDVASEITRRTGVRIKFVDATANPDQKLEYMLTHKEFPDIILMSQGEMVNRYIEAGVFIPINLWVKEYGPNITAMYGDILKKSETSNSKNYWLANWYGVDLDASAGVLMRRDLLSEIVGKERAYSNEPFTLSEYTEILQAFKEKFPVLNEMDSIPLSIDGDEENYTATLSGMFGMKTYGQDEEGLHYLPATKRYESALYYLNELYRKELLDKEWVIQKNARLLEKLSAGNVFSTWASYWETDEVNLALKKNVGPDAGFYSYKVVADDLSPEETTYNGRSTLGWDAIGITESCKYRKEAIQFLDFLASEEGQYLLLWGIEGRTWNRIQGVHTPNLNFLVNWEDSNAFLSINTGIRKYLWMIKNGRGSDGSPYDLTTKYRPTETSRFANASFAESDYWDTAEYLGLEPTIQSGLAFSWNRILALFEEDKARIICAESQEEAEAFYENMVESMKTIGLEECEKYITGQYTRRLEKWNTD